jgi:aminoglycoside phosphotransferase (APT) family kinase protein
MSISQLITSSLAQQLINEQFQEFSELAIQPVTVQGHDNRSFRLGSDMLMRMPTEKTYAIKVPIEQKILTQLSPYLSTAIPTPIKLGQPSNIYPFHFSIYRWLPGKSINHCQLDGKTKEALALSLAAFLTELHAIDVTNGPSPGQHNWWRCDHISVYDHQARHQIATLKDKIDSHKAFALWEKALSAKWPKAPVWIHGDFACGNILINDGALSGIIDFGCAGVGDPACDLAINWTLFEGKSKSCF